MVVIAQLAEHRIVVPSVVGSSPTLHPKESHSALFSFAIQGTQIVTLGHKKRRLSHDNPTFSFNLKSNTMKNTVQKYCFLAI